ncbi:hypothetical protein ACN4EK_25895 [Pantanalinema rosaneae CENA516]|uniref:hypothetical protein n=1 Tax=Pantanalinema rosaneae TaxID=1620701 RepID=UPI003D6FBE06
MSPSCQNPDCPDGGGETNNLTRYGRDRAGHQRYRCKTCQQIQTEKTEVRPGMRQAWQKKRVRVGHQSRRGVPELYDEPKTGVSMSLTPTGVKGLDRLAAATGRSRSEVVEWVGRHSDRLEPFIGAMASGEQVNSTAPTHSWCLILPEELTEPTSEPFPFHQLVQATASVAGKFLEMLHSA